MSDREYGVKLTADGSDLVGAARASAAEIDKLGQSTGKLTSEAARLNEQQKNLGQTLNVTSSGIGLYSAAWSKATDIIFQATSAVKDYIKEAALLNARHETMGIVMEVVGRNAGYSRDQMNSAAEGVRKMGITMLESRESVVKLVQANLDLSIATKLARGAQDAAVIANINSSQAFERMIYGIQSGQTDVLRTMGINVNFEDSYKKLSKQIGVTTEQLTEQEKVQSRANTVLEAAARITGSYEAAMSTAGKQINSLARYEEDLKLLRGQVFNDALVIAVNAYTNSLKDANEEARRLSDNKKLQEWGRDLVTTFAWVGDIIIGAFHGISSAVELTTLAVMKGVQQLANLSPPTALLFNAAGGDAAVAAFGDRAQQNLGQRLNRTQFRDSAAEFFGQRDADAMRSSQRDQIEAFTGSGLTGAAASGARPSGKVQGSDMQDYVLHLKEQLEITRQSSVEDRVLFELREKHWKNATPALREQAAELAKQMDARERDKAALEAYVRTAQIGLEVDQEHANLLAAIQKKKDDAINSTQKIIEQIEFETQLIGLSSAERERAIALRNLEISGIDKESQAYANFREKLSGVIDAKNAKQGLADSAKKLEADFNRSAENIERTLTDSLMRGFENGKGFGENFRDTLVNIFKTTVLRPVIQMQVQPFANAISGMLPSGGSGGIFGALGNLLGLNGPSYVTGGGAGSTWTSGYDLMPNANGNAFHSRGLSALSGTIIDRPTIIPFARGGILAGEAGDEGVFPLKRGPDGKLGVAASGGGNGGAVYNIDARGADPAGLNRVYRLIEQLHGQIKPIALDAVAEAGARGYNFR